MHALDLAEVETESRRCFPVLVKWIGLGNYRASLHLSSLMYRWQCVDLHMRDRRNLVVLRDADGHSYQWHDGPLSQWVSPPAPDGPWEPEVTIWEVYVNPFESVMCEALFRCDLSFSSDLLGTYVCPGSQLLDPAFRLDLYQQISHRLPALPFAEEVECSLLPLPPDLDARGFQAQARRQLSYHQVFVTRSWHPRLPPGAPPLWNLFDLPFYILDRGGTVCPSCRRAFVYAGACLSGEFLLRRINGDLLRKPMMCDYAPGRLLGLQQEQEEDESEEAEADDEEPTFHDRTHTQMHVERRYSSHHHFQECWAAILGMQDTIIEPEIIRDIHEFTSMRRQVPVTAAHARRALGTLEIYVRGRYEPWYSDSQLIANYINHGAAHGPEPQAIPDLHLKRMKDVFFRMQKEFARAPEDVRGRRKNFLQNRHLMWVVCTLCARLHADAIYLQYRDMYLRNEDGQPPRLKDTSRHIEYVRIINWILARLGWGSIQM